MEEKRDCIQPQQRARLTRRKVVIGLSGAASVLAAIGAPFLVNTVQNLLATRSQEITISQISLEHSFLAGIAWSPDGKKLAACDDTGMMQIWNIANPLARSKSMLRVNVVSRGAVQLFTIPGGQGDSLPIVNAITWSPTGQYIAIASESASILDATTGAYIRSLEPSGKGDVVQIAWSPDGQYIATANADGTTRSGNTRIHIWATNSWTQVKQLAGDYDTLSSMAWSSDSKKLLIAGDISTNAALRSNVQIWDIEIATPLLLKKADYTGRTSGAIWSPDGNFFAVGIGEKNGSVLRVYHAAGTFRSTYASNDQSGLVAMNWSPANHIVAVFGPSVGNANMTVYNWDVSNGQLLSTSTSAQTGEQGGWDQYHFVWSPDGKQVAYTLASELVIWQPE